MVIANIIGNKDKLAHESSSFPLDLLLNWKA